MKINQLQEGIIKVPPILIHKCRKELLKFISTTIVSASDDSVLFRRHLSIDYIPEFKYHGDAYDLYAEVGEILGVKVEYDESLIAYSDDNGKSSFILGAGIIEKNPNTHGIYLPERNTIIINLHTLWKNVRDSISLYDWFGEGNEGKIAYENETLESRIDVLNTFIRDDLNRHVNHFMSTINSTIEHELAHMIQYQYLKKKSVDQVTSYDDTKDAVKYYSSQVEFSPQIISAINDIAAYVGEVGDEVSPEYLDYVVKYLVGEIPNAATLHRIAKEQGIQSPSDPFLAFSSTVDNSRNFFLVLRDKKPKAWRKAVKYLTTEIKKLDLW